MELGEREQRRVRGRLPRQQERQGRQKQQGGQEQQEFQGRFCRERVFHRRCRDADARVHQAAAARRGATVVVIPRAQVTPLPDPPGPDAASRAVSPPAPLNFSSFLHPIFSNTQPLLHCLDNLLRVRQVDCCVLHPLCISVSTRVFGPARCCRRSSTDPPRSRARASCPVLAATNA